jgi:hypothetical protein
MPEIATAIRPFTLPHTPGGGRGGRKKGEGKGEIEEGGGGFEV